MQRTGHAAGDSSDGGPTVDLEGPRYNARSLHEYREAALACIDFSRYSRLVSSLLRTKVGLITFHDEKYQFALAETNSYATKVIPEIMPRKSSVCQYTLQQNNRPFVVEDLSVDSRFDGLDCVRGGPELKAYAGFPIHSQEGFNIGAVCALDDHQRQWSDAELTILEDLSRMISNDLMLHFKTKDVLIQQKMQNSIVSFVRSNLADCSKPCDQKLNRFVSDFSSVYDNASRILDSTLEVDGVMIVDINEILRMRSSWPTVSKRPRASLLAYRYSHSNVCVDLSALDRKFCVDLVNLGGSVFRSQLPEVLRNTLGPEAQEAVVVPLYDSDNEPYALVIVYRTTSEVSFTATDKQYIEAFGSTLILELQRAKFREADDAKAKFIRSLSHELRTPLHGLIHNLEMLSETSLDEEQSELLQEIKTCSNLQLSVVESVLEFNEIQGAPSISASSDTTAADLLQAVDVVAVVEEAVASAISRQRRTSENQKASGMPNVLVDCPLFAEVSRIRRTDAKSLKRIVHELVSNSLKWTFAGFVKIAIDLPKESDVQDVYITVSDTGSGIGPEFIQHNLYKSFSQEDSFTVGLGLGLSLVSETVKSLGGLIDIESVKGSHTTVYLKLPMAVCPDEIILAKPKIHGRVGILLHDELTSGQRSMLTTLERDLKQNQGLNVQQIRPNSSIEGVELIFASSCLHKGNLDPKIPWILVDGSIDNEEDPEGCTVRHLSPYYGPHLLSQFMNSIENLNAEHRQPLTMFKGRKRELSIHSRDAISNPHSFKSNSKASANAAKTIATPTSVGSLTDATAKQVSGYFDISAPQIPANCAIVETVQAATETTLTPQIESTTFADTLDSNALPSPLPSPKVLIVEDNSTNARLLIRFMQKKGFESVAVVNGLEAIKAVETAHEIGNQQFDVILMVS